MKKVFVKITDHSYGHVSNECLSQQFAGILAVDARGVCTKKHLPTNIRTEDVLTVDNMYNRNK